MTQRTSSLVLILANLTSRAWFRASANTKGLTVIVDAASIRRPLGKISQGFRPLNQPLIQASVLISLADFCDRGLCRVLSKGCIVD
jgi:hypothetical protein